MFENAAATIAASFKKQGLRPTISVKDKNTYVFGESGKWNRIGAYIVHVALLTLFLGHFVALQTGFDADVGFRPGDKKTEIEMIEFNLDNKSGLRLVCRFQLNAQIYSKS